MAVNTKESGFEDYIVNYLVNYNNYRLRNSQKHYDKKQCLDKELLINFITTTQPEKWNRLRKQFDEDAESHFINRVVKEINIRGTIDVLREGINDTGNDFKLAYFKPNSSLNEDTQKLYEANIFSVIRQLLYSEKTKDELDLAIFINGLPIITTELKNPFTKQNVDDAIKQYKKSRNPKEPLFKFGRCLTHFAVDADLVYMTTELKEDATFFVPFNKGNENGGAGNPINNEKDGYKTYYLWENIWEKDTLLNIINNFVQMVEIRDDKGKRTGKKKLIFPRYHQLYTVNMLIEHAKEHGTPYNYLIQHSAGSGKSNTIAWLCHQLSVLHNSNDERVFDSIFVITDRRVLDIQLRNTIQQFQKVKGTVEAIDKKKSKKLVEALESNKDIIISTLQTFPFAVEKIQEYPGKRFAVVIDEAHSSQSGETSKSINKILSPNDLKDAEQMDIFADSEDDEDLINKIIEEEQQNRQRPNNISFFAFTATPKNKTLELFGNRQPDGKFKPFSLYTMKQAIEEGFIFDVLKNYTTYEVYFNLLKRINDDPEYEKRKATRVIKNYVSLHPHAVSEKTKIILDHFNNNVKSKIGGKAKAMLITSSRLHAVRYKLEFDHQIKFNRLNFKVVVAFSGELIDPDSQKTYTEPKMNGFSEKRTVENFKKDEYKIIIVANKYQTGFDQPLLHTMYVDKKLGGVNAVQTLSRLNRKHPQKTDTMVLDFVNDDESILESFQPYYKATLLSGGTDPNKLYDIQRELETFFIYDERDIDNFNKDYFNKNSSPDKLNNIIDSVIKTYLEKEKDEQLLFRQKLKSYIRIYSFISQIIRFIDVRLEKTYIFAKFLLPKLPYKGTALPDEIKDNINIESYRIEEIQTRSLLFENEAGELSPLSDGASKSADEDKEGLSVILEYINEHYGTDFTDEDKVIMFRDDIIRRSKKNEDLIKALDPDINTEENAKLAFDEYFNKIASDMIDTNVDIYNELYNNEEFGKVFRDAIFKSLFEYIKRGKGD